MKTSDPTNAELDTGINHAWANLNAARRAATRSPNSDTLAAEQDAEDTLNKLLEQRLTHAY